jgi:uncharacterized lipoprotein YddW (UPF0748 family)
MRADWATGSALLVLVSCLPVSPAWGQTLVVDNDDPGFSVLSQSWPTASVAGQYGNDYRYRSTTQAPGEVEWRPTITVPGDYTVSVWYRSGNDRPYNAPYTVHYDGGSQVVPVDQRVNGSQWVPIGTYPFAAGNTGSIQLSSAAEPGKSIVADAVRFYRPPDGTAVPELRACWLTHYKYLPADEAGLRAIAQNIRAGNMNTVYFAVYSGATVWWPSKAYQSAGGSWGSGATDYGERLIRIFHEEGLKVGAWFEYGLALGPASHPIAQAHPEWLARDRAGDPVTGENGGFVFISPGSADGVAMVVEMARELAANYNFDDIQLDRIRWGRKTTGREYGYEDCTADLYRAVYGVDPPNNVDNPTWVAFREGLVNDVMDQCYNAIKSENPEIVVSSAPTGAYGITQHMQRWSDWVEGGYMDLVMPQMYKTTLSAFITEFNTQAAQAPAHIDKLGVGYRASDPNDWTLVADQLLYAQSQGVPHGCLWVYHTYSSQVAIQDEIDHLPLTGQPWAPPAYNPYASDRMWQIIVDNLDGAPRYAETGGWINSAQPDFFRFNSRVAAGGAPSEARFSAEIPISGRYDAFVWYTASGNRNDAAPYTVTHFNGESVIVVDQRTDGGQWVPAGRWIFEAGPMSERVSVSTAGSDAGEYTSSDAVKLVLSGYALGDADGDGKVVFAEFEGASLCMTGPAGGPIGAACEAFDFNDDTDIDLADLASFQTFFTGP